MRRTDVRRTTAAAGSSIFFACAPGVVAGLIPWYLTQWEVNGPLPRWWWLAQAVGVAMLMAGAGVLVRSFVRFVTEGIGTPAPVAPTERLVIGGPYRHVRNPMYLAVLAIILGQALLLRQPSLLIYAAAAGLAMAAFARWYEEPALARRFGDDYDAYRRAVRAWRPRRRPFVARPRS